MEPRRQVIVAAAAILPLMFGIMCHFNGMEKMRIALVVVVIYAVECLFVIKWVMM